MITVENIIEWAKPHPLDGGKMTRLYNEEIEFSIVGGRSGLYGDFVDDFEVAVLDRKTGDFRTKFFKPELSDDVIGYMPKDDMIQMLNQILKTGFQVR
jgi:hypothetical protein|tara:strand:- start:60 stop:353 length:294 start_codon:yes stop_codon:yes gene_type:complete